MNKCWNSFLADHSLFFWDKNHGRILENKTHLTTSMAHLKGPVPLPSTARVCWWRGALKGCVQLPSSPRDGHWDEGPHHTWLPSATLHLCSCQAAGLAEDLGEHFGLRGASSVKFTVALF